MTATYCGREENKTGRIWCQSVNEDVKIPFDLEFESKGCIPEYDQPRGFFRCLKNVKIGETAHFQLGCNNFYTFGSKGSEKFKIPPNTNLFYEITVTMIQKYEMNGDFLESKEKLPRAIEIKDLANVYFQKEKFRVANKL